MKEMMIAGACLLAAVTPSNASAMAPDHVHQSKRVSVAGSQLDYTSTYDTMGRLRLSGLETDSGKRFNFRVYSDGFVSGTVEGKPVTFWVPRHRAMKLAAGGKSAQGGTAVSAGTQ